MSGDVFAALYTSTAAAPFDDDALAELLAASREANRRSDITGMLLYRRGRFVQVLEGAEHEVRALLERIRADARHGDVRVLLDERIPTRQFADWSMGYQRTTGADEAPPAGFRDTFADLDEAADDSVVARAARELSMWFRVRSGQPPIAGGA
ncbi:hypothetical protein GCM10027515_04040 [Schumannella luteola]|uniref:BLUF domain-containing protein n=1 Tax=Schumannella luteola TaxID=472059 RepID=A0A852YAS6_9MICO|nr:hypothetical protein [Schumannella luteola]TPX01311.1 BLUF domain-containing protein [Schumannella luteola]